MRAKFYSIESGTDTHVVKLTLEISPKKWDILRYTGATEFDVYVAEDMPRDFPLTPEILERAGFRLEEVGDNGAATPPQYRNRFEKWIAHTTWKDCILWYDRRADYYNISGLEAAHLHTTRQLQRALDLVGIPIKINE